MLKIALALAAVASAPAPVHAAPSADAAPVIAAEQAFAARASEVGVNRSFLEFMAEGAFIFAPGPVSAKAFYSAMPPGKPPKSGGTLLAWWPNFAGVSRAGDLGFTTGPATINGGPPQIFYFTVWARQADGTWKWIYDGGIDADGAAAPGPTIAPTLVAPGDLRPMSAAQAWRQVVDAESDLARRAASNAAAALKSALEPDARIQGPGSPPTAALDKALSLRPTVIRYRLVGGGASRSGDLAWTWGDVSRDSSEAAKGPSHFVRVWRRSAGRWAVVFDQII